MRRSTFIGSEVRGLDSVKAMLSNIHNMFSNLKMEMVSNASDGDYNFLLVKMTGTCKGPSMGCLLKQK